MDEGFEFELGLVDGVSAPARAEKTVLASLEKQILSTEQAIRGLQREQHNYRRAGFAGAAKDVGLEAQGIRLHLGELRAEQKRHLGEFRVEQKRHLGELRAEQKRHLGELRAEQKRHRAEQKRTSQDRKQWDVAGQYIKGIGPAMVLAAAVKGIGEASEFAVEKTAQITFEATRFSVEAAQFKENTELAYAAVKGTAEEGENTFRTFDALASQLHFPAQKAHALAQELMLQGVDDTRLVGAVITANAELIRTGQERGADKLRTIVERSVASGHFDPGKLGGAKGGAPSGRALAGLGVSLPNLLDSLAKRTGHGVAQVQDELKRGAIDVDIGIAALTDAINEGVIGKTAGAKFSIEDFTTDVKNDFTRMVQDVDLKPLENALYDVDTVLGFITGRKDGVQGVFQTIIDWVGNAIDSITIFGLDVEIGFLQAEAAAKPFIDSIKQIGSEIDAVIEKVTGTSIGGGVLRGLLPSGVPELFEAYQRDSNAMSEAGKANAILSGLDIGKGLVEGARQGTDAHSPSEEMRDLGGDMADGVELGFRTDGLQKEMAGMGAPSSGGGTQIDVGGIHVHVGNGADHHEIASAVESATIDVWERLASELGN